jgi:hypothetical protein
MSKVPQKPIPGAKTTAGTTKGPTSTTSTTKGPDPKHLPREFKYLLYNLETNFLKKYRLAQIHLTSMMKQSKSNKRMIDKPIFSNSMIS